MMLFLAEDDLVIKDQIHLENGLAVVIAVCLLLAVVLVALVVWLARPSRKPAKIVNRGRHDAFAGKTVWHQRIDDVVSRHARGELEREEAFAQLAAIARDFASTATGTDVRNQTLTDIEETPRTTGNQQGLTLLRQTIEALYPPEFADAERNHIARQATVEQAGGQSCGKVAIDATVMALALGLSGRRHRGAGRCRRHVAGGRAPQNRWHRECPHLQPG